MKEDARVLVVDDEPMVCLALTNWLEEENYFAQAVEDGPQAVQAVREENWDIVLLDLRMPGMDGMEVLKQVKEIAPQTVVIMMTAYASIPGAVQAMQEGAYDYIVKPLDVDQLTLMLKRIVEHQQLITENILLRKRLTEQYEYEDIIGRSEAMQEVFSMIKAVTDTNATVLITGETGTGKELVARAIHSNSSQRYGPFVATSCGALPETLLESELFGYEKGAFTGADRTKKGRFELANEGTLFLDEVGDISMKTQIRLLRVLQEKSFSRLGGTEQIKVDVRLVSATNRDLVAAIEEGSFRSDLYYRLNVVSIQLPPLRERIDDVPLLAAHFINKYNVEFNKKFDRVDRKAMDLMMDYHWPGNVRELENVIERALVIDQGPQMMVKHLPFCNIESPLTEEPRSLQEVEKSHIEKMLQRNDWNIAKTARLLNIDRSTLHKKIKKFGLERQQ
ncbi:MAG: sigma-54 dependent transcriptional regulator [Deltaproteobacteria bacterium]|nr:sigma-54 dependent transcriptional regulator [Deltaproteobacteria bacterium]MDH3897128.1 sigma-54 dependent transcriptional regulator [Deltaproteobacteria bacterium]MDH3928421.1 sigma-54 dependent transcriptional regulator [Deltaproteobacteria bacterium]MDH3963499.1 sigma-54 dependent transcriptional regulator [Deltaproteobacteria bacterium]